MKIFNVSEIAPSYDNLVKAMVETRKKIIKLQAEINCLNNAIEMIYFCFSNTVFWP